MRIAGIQIIESPYAYRTVFKVVKWSIKKRRRQWKVVKEQEPCAYLIGNDKAVVHPALAAQLRGIK